MKAHDIVVTAYSPLGSKSPEGESSPLDDQTVKEIAKKVGSEPGQVGALLRTDCASLDDRTCTAAPRKSAGRWAP